ncbi:MAG: prenyltransferase/squalene oxidase repeat-containing protein [Candidatus Hodarchaeales archaeon]
MKDIINEKDLITEFHQKASHVDSLRLKAALGNQEARLQLIKHFSTIQLSSGGFSSIEDNYNSYSLTQTFRVYQILKELKSNDHIQDLIKKIIVFVKDLQNSDGSWSENSELPLDGTPSDERIFLTSAIATLMLVVEQPGSKECMKGLNFLKRNQKDDRTFKGDLPTNWFSAAALLGYYGIYYMTGKEMTLIIDEILDSEDDVAHIQSIASSLILAGYNQRNLEVLDRALYLLEKKRDNRGYWSSNRDKDDIRTSINCLITLLRKDATE